MSNKYLIKEKLDALGVAASLVYDKLLEAQEHATKHPELRDEMRKLEDGLKYHFEIIQDLRKTFNDELIKRTTENA